MKRSKFLVIALILVLSLAVALCACEKKPEEDDTPVVQEECTITYVDSEGVKFLSDNPAKAIKGQSVVIKFELDVFYSGDPVVNVGSREKDAEYDEDTDTYSAEVTIHQNSDISVTGVVPAESDLLSTGTGASDSPFLISEPIDLIKMAEVINSGADNSVMSVLGYYVLENDIDLKGNELPIIGDGNNDYAFFGGYFNGDGHTISNFKINSSGKDFVGLFGVVQGYYEESLGYTGGMIYNLKLSDYTITAVNTGSTVTCGSFVGQGFGANLVLCEAINGTIDVMGDINYFSYAGGIIGLQRAYQYPYYSKLSYCSTDNVTILCSNGTTYAAGGIAGYVYSDDDTIVSSITNCYTSGNVSGAFHAGGIVGWLSNYTSITACYSLSDIHAQSHISNVATMEDYCHAYAGGLVGMSQLDSVIADSFSTGSVTAYAAAGTQYAHIGKIVGRTENLEDGLYSAKEAGVFNSYGSEDNIDFKNSQNVKTILGWHEIDWIIKDGAYPVVNSVNSYTDDDEEIEHYEYKVTLDFGGRQDLDGNTSFVAEFKDQYESMSYWYTVYSYSDPSDIDGIPGTIYSTDGYVSYGYFFDEALTIPVAAGFIPTRDVTLHVGFANNNDVAGTYYIVPKSDYEQSNTAVVELIIDVDGTYTCTDVYGSYDGTYIYNGNYVVFDSARFARYAGEGTIANHQSYEFKAVKASYGFDLYGALYSDEDLSEIVELVSRDNPLKVVRKGEVIIGSYYNKSGANTEIFEFFANGSGYVYENGIDTEFVYTVSGQTVTIVIGDEEISGTLNNGIPQIINSESVTPVDAYRGKWQILALPQKYIEFDGAGNWEYTCLGYETSDGEMYETIIGSASGTYEVNQGALVLDNGWAVSLEDGFVTVSSADASSIYGGVDSHYGLWINQEKDIAIELKGIGADGYGNARVKFSTETDGRVRNEIYELTYAHDLLNEGNIVLSYQGEYYGNLVYDKDKGVLQGSIYSLSVSDMINIRLYRVDEYKGEWISSDSTFGAVEFNGYGVYTAWGDVKLSGTISFNGNNINYRLDDFSLSGIFTYGGKAYKIELDEGRSIITVSEGGNTIELTRKDEFGGKVFLDADGATYVFDGRGQLDSKGKLTVTNNGSEKNYSYNFGTDGKVIVYDSEGAQVGGIAVEGEVGSRHYVLTLNGSQITLGEKTQFTGTWALKASFGIPVEIGTMNYDKVLEGKVPLVINNKSDIYPAHFVLVDDEYLLWTYNESVSLYVVQLSDGMFVMSLHLNWFNYENDDDNGEWNYSYMMTPDDLTGSWTCDALSELLVFDGMGCNPEGLGMYSISNMWADSDDADELIRYYGYFQNTQTGEWDFLIFNQYSSYAKSAQKVVFKKATHVAGAQEYINKDDEDKAFVLEYINLKDYDISR